MRSWLFVLVLVVVGGCAFKSEPHLIAEIKLPGDNYLVRADVPIYGDAAGDDFDSYRLEYGRGADPAEWVLINESSDSTMYDESENEYNDKDEGVLFGNLGTWRTGLTAYRYGKQTTNLSGLYTLRLIVYAKDGRCKTSYRSLTVGKVVLNAHGGVVTSEDEVVQIALKEYSLYDVARIFAIEPAGNNITIDGYSLVGSLYRFQPNEERFLRPATFLWSIPEDLLNSDFVGLYQVDDKKKSVAFVSASLRGNTLRAVVDELPGSEFLFGVFIKEALPSAPYDVRFKKVFDNQKEQMLEGCADLNTTVVLVVNGVEVEKIKTDTQGIFVFSSLFLHAAVKSLELYAVDEFGRRSTTTQCLNTPVEGESVRIGSLYAMRNWFTKRESPFVSLHDELKIEAFGSDPDENSIDSAVVKVGSESDPNGVYLELIETEVDSGLYRGIITIGDETSQSERTVKAEAHLERISVVSETGECEYLAVQYNDTVPPLPPKVRSIIPVNACEETFEYGIGAESRIDGTYGAQLSLKSHGLGQMLELTNPETYASFAYQLNSEAVDVLIFPFLSFDYKMPNDLQVSLFLKNSEGWFEIVLGEEKEYRRVGIVPLHSEDSLIKDDAWHSVTINVQQMLRNVTKDFTITEIVLSDWAHVGYGRMRSGSNLKGMQYWLDNVKCWNMTNQSDLLFKYELCADAVDGVYRLMREDEEIDQGSLGQESGILSFDGLNDGCYRLEVQSVDGAGNKSFVLKKTFVIDAEAPMQGESLIEDHALSINVSDICSGVDPHSLKVEVGNREYDYYSDVVTFDYGKSQLKILFKTVEPLLLENDSINITIMELRDYAGNAIAAPYEVIFDSDSILHALRVDEPRVWSQVYQVNGENYAIITWESDAGAGSQYSYSYDTNPFVSMSNMKSSYQTTLIKKIESSADTNYFHLRVKNRLGIWSDSVHHQISTSDISFEGVSRILVDDFEASEWITLKNAKIWRNALGGKLYRFSDGFTDIETLHVREAENTAYKISYEGVTPLGPEGATYCGWQVLLPTIDVRKCNVLRFRVKGMHGGEIPNVYLSDGDIDAYVDLEDYVTITQEWQTVSLPLVAFVKKGLNVSMLKELRLVFEWDRMDSTIWIDDITFIAVQLPEQPVVEHIDERDGRFVISGTFSSERVVSRVKYAGFDQWCETYCSDKGGRYSIVINDNVEKVRIQSQGKNGEFSIPLDLDVPESESIVSSDMIANFNNMSSRVTWWDIDGIAVYDRVLKRDVNENVYAEIYVKKNRLRPWSFTALSLESDVAISDISHAEGLSLKLRNIDPHDLLLKLQDHDGEELVLCPLESDSSGNQEEWTLLHYPFPINHTLDLTHIKNILFFAYPGSSTKEGSFCIDDIQIY